MLLYFQHYVFHKQCKQVCMTLGRQPVLNTGSSFSFSVQHFSIHLRFVLFYLYLFSAFHDAEFGLHIIFQYLYVEHNLTFK